MTNWLKKYEQGGLILKKKTKDNFGKKFNPNDVQASVGPGFVGMGNDITGRNYSPAWGGQFQDGGILGKTFLQPNDPKLPKGWNPEAKGYSTEYSTTIGKDGEYYLVPGFKHGKLLSDPEKEFHSTGELLGGPFKTIQSAEDFANRRHKYVEKGQPLPSPMKTYDYLKFAMGGALPGAVGFMYARTINPAPANGKYAKKTKASAQNGQEMQFYQEGLDFTPKTISQNGLLMSFEPEKVRQDATRVAAPIRPLTKKEQEENAKINKANQKKTEERNKKIVAERQANKNTKGDLSTPGSWHTADKLRLFPGSVGGVGEMFDEYVNPAYLVGSLTDQLGESIARRDIGGVATTLGLTAGLGALGVDPLGDAMKAQRWSQKAVNNLGYDVQTAGPSSRGLGSSARNIEPISTAERAQQQLDLIRQQRLSEAVSQGSQRTRVPYQFPTDEELAAMNLRDAERYAPRVSHSDEMINQLNQSRSTLSGISDSQAESAQQAAMNDIRSEAAVSRNRSNVIHPNNPTMTEDRLLRRQTALRTSAFTDAEIAADEAAIRRGEPLRTPSQIRGGGQGTFDLGRNRSETPMKEWDPKTFRIGEGNEQGIIKMEHPEGHIIKQDISTGSGVDSPTFRNYEVSDKAKGSNYIKVETSQDPGDPFTDVNDISFFNRDPTSSSKQMNIVFSHLPTKARIAPINTSIHSQPLLDTRMAKLSSGQPGRIQIKPEYMGALNKITRETSGGPLTWYNEIIQQFPKLQRTTQNLNEYTGAGLSEPFIKYKGSPIPFEEFNTPEMKSLFENPHSHFDALNNTDVMVNKYKTIKNWKNGGHFIDAMGQWAHPGDITTIPSNDITMKGINYNVLGVSNTGDKKLMKPGKNYKFDGDYVTEYPKGGWLNKYK